MKKILIATLAIFANLAAFAADWYVDPSHPGSNSGTLANPWKTLSAINWTSIQPGDNIYFRRGQKFQGTLTIGKSGTASARITLGAYGTGTNPLFWGTGSSISQLFNMSNRAYITFQDLTISDTTISPTDRTIQAKIERVWSNGGTFMEIRRCTLDRVGVGAYWTGGNNLMDSCDIGNMRMVRNTPTSVNNDDDYGANPLVISSAGNTISNNYFHDCWAVSYDYGFDGGAVEFYGNGASNNTVMYNTFYDCNGVVESGSGNAGTIENNLFAYNKMIRNSSLFFISNSGSFVVTVRNMQFYNNVIVEDTAHRLNESNMCALRVASSDAGIVVMKNNIWYLNNGIDVFRPNQFTGSQVIAENNIYRLGSGSLLNRTLGATEIQTSTAASNIWAATSGNPITWDFRLKTGSPAIEFGQAISGQSRDFAGQPIVGKPEAGLYEFGVTVTPPPPPPPVTPPVRTYILQSPYKIVQ